MNKIKLIIVLVVMVIASAYIFIANANNIDDVDKNYVLDYLDKTYGFLGRINDLISSSDEYGMKAEMNINQAIKTSESIYRGLLELEVPEQCLEHQALALKVVQTSKERFEEWKVYKGRIYTDEEFVGTALEKLAVEEELQKEYYKILQSIDYWKVKELGVTENNIHKFERSEEGIYLRKERDSPFLGDRSK